jgi:putative tricarboxylic transport membrane protein
MQQTGAGRKRMVGELLMAAAFLALAGLIFEQTGTVFAEAGAASGGAMQNAAMYPEFLAGALVLLALLQIVRTLWGAGAGLPAGTTVGDARVRLTGDERRRHLVKALVCATAFVVYLLVLRVVGYHLATPVLMAVLYFTLGVRNPLVAAILGVATSLLMSLFFEVGLNVILPVGRFGIGF